MRWTALTAVLALVLVACGSSEPGGSGPAAGIEPADELVGMDWVLVEGVPMVEGYPITLRIADGQVAGTAACNSYGGAVEVTDGRIAVGDIAHTQMGCAEPGVHDSESAFLDLLQTVERYERAGDQLLLVAPDIALRFDPVAPVEDAVLTGTDWQLDSLVTGTGPDGTASSTMAEATLRLDEDGTFTASDGCNDLDGRWALEGDVLMTSEVITTDVACPPIAQQVEHVGAVLLGEPAVALEGRSLLLTAGDRALGYRPPDGDAQPRR